MGRRAAIVGNGRGEPPDSSSGPRPAGRRSFTFFPPRTLVRTIDVGPFPPGTTTETVKIAVQQAADAASEGGVPLSTALLPVLDGREFGNAVIVQVVVLLPPEDQPPT